MCRAIYFVILIHESIQKQSLFITVTTQPRRTTESCFTMGWGAPPEQKRYSMGSSRILAPDLYDFKATTIIIDVTAVLRHRFAHAAATRSPPRQAVGQFMKWVGATYGNNVRTMVLCIDVPSTMPPARINFYKTRRYTKEDTSEKINHHLITPDYIPTDWGSIWSQPEAKAAMWKIIHLLLADYAELTQDGITRIVDGPLGTNGWKNGQMNEYAQENWGEADVRCYRWARTLDKPGETIVIDTIDFDMLLQVSIHNFISKVLLRLGTAYSAPGVYSAKKAAQVRAKRVHELVDVNSFASRPQALGVHRLFVMLAMGGVDYCKGLVRFGTNFATLSRHLERDAGFIRMAVIPTEEAVVSPLKRSITFDTKRFTRWFLGVKIRKSKHSMEDFVSELASMMFCVAYFFGFDMGGASAGPDESGIRRVVHEAYPNKDVDFNSGFYRADCSSFDIVDK